MMAENRMEAALDSLEQAETFSPSDPEISLLQAEIYIYKGWPEDSLSILEELKNGAGSRLLSDIYFVEALAYENQHMYEILFIFYPF